MNRAFLRWFYVAVQFVMLAVSIPKVATLFHAYDTELLGPLIGGLDIRSWLVGVVIDLCAAFTTWAAMAKYDESRKRSALVAPAGIIFFCTALSVIANYEDAATLRPEQYAAVSLFNNPALLINPLLISTPPVLVLLLVVLVPSVLARPRLKSAAEIEAEADEQEARIAASARIREAKARANARVWSTRLKGAAETLNAVTRAPEQESADTGELESQPFTDRQEESSDDAPLAVPAKMTRAMWQVLKLQERVQQSGVITTQEVAEVTGISRTMARILISDVRSGQHTVEGRRGVSPSDLIDRLYDSRTKENYARAHSLEMALGIRKRSRTLQTAPGDETGDGGDSEEVELGSVGD